MFDIIDKRWDNKLKTPLHRAGYYLNPHYYYPNKLDIELDESFREGLITRITKMIDDVDVQDQIIQEIAQYLDGEGSFGKEIARRQWRHKHFDPGTPFLLGQYVIDLLVSLIYILSPCLKLNGD